ncbi:MAG: type II secretion system protein GspJ [Synergistetes bacterium]|nr:type II secretion system protein GspJ [Synergistota bacterium]MCX8128382.1 type II secretion system protein GspJ [Synergistota bacterium]MDW8192418.1 prepilin-type N-terminal cleavage/methylation domain-containing protein [Synergistota bacterium]
MRKGLTLIELLIALAIAALIGGTLLGLLMGATRSREFSENVALENQIVRGILELLYSDLRASFQIKTGLNFVGEKTRLSFLKAGRNGLEKVDYELKDGKLLRNNEVLLEDGSFGISFKFIKDKKYMEVWEVQGDKPDAVEVEIKYRGASYKRLILTY